MNDFFIDSTPEHKTIHKRTTVPNFNSCPFSHIFITKDVPSKK